MAPAASAAGYVPVYADLWLHRRSHASKLDAFKSQIVRWLDAHPYSAQQIFQRLGETG